MLRLKANARPTCEPCQISKPTTGQPWQTVADEHNGPRSFPSYSAAKRQLGSRPGQELHHIVEQSQAKPDRSGFSVERINTTDNLAWLPRPVHKQVSADYSRVVQGTNRTLRDNLNGTDWDDQYRRGVRAVNRAFREVARRDEAERHDGT